MSKPCADVPDYIWISNFANAKPGGNKEHVSRVPWTPALIERCHAMREVGETWPEIARMVQEETGALLSDGGISDYIMRYYGEK